MTYRLSVYASRGTELIFDQDYASLKVSFGAFMLLAKQRISDLDVCVILSRSHDDHSGTTLACKSTDASHIEIGPAYFD